MEKACGRAGAPLLGRAQRLSFLVGLSVVVCSLAPEAWAKGGFDANRFMAPPLATDGLGVLRPATLEGSTIGVALTVSYADDPFVERVATGRGSIEEFSIISDQLWSWLSFGWGLGDRLTVHGILPISIHQDGSTRFASGVTSSLHSAAVGDLGLGARLRLFGGTESSVLGAAIDGVMFIPTGSREAFASDGKVRVRGTLIVEAVPISALYATLNAGVLTRPEIAVADVITANTLQITAAAGFRTSNDFLRVGLEGSLQEPLGEKGTGFETLVVGAVQLWGLHVTAGVGPGFGDGPGTPDWRAVARVGWGKAAK